MTELPVSTGAVLDALTGEVTGRPGWDEPPALFLIRYRAGRARLRPVPVDNWSPQPVAVLAALADEMAARAPVVRELLAAPDLYGAAFRFEAYTVFTRDEQVMEDANKDAGARRLRTRPDRVETRMVQAVDRAGGSYLVSLARGEQEPLTAYSPGRGEVQAGTVMKALDVMVGSLLGVPLPARPDDLDMGPEVRARAFRRKTR